MHLVMNLLKLGLVLAVAWTAVRYCTGVAENALMMKYTPSRRTAALVAGISRGEVVLWWKMRSQDSAPWSGNR